MKYIEYVFTLITFAIIYSGFYIQFKDQYWKESYFLFSRDDQKANCDPAEAISRLQQPYENTYNTSAEQYEHYLTLSFDDDVKEIHLISDVYTYEYEVIVIGREFNEDGYYLMVNERDEITSTYSRGGTYFLINYKHSANELCIYKDMFNGTYFIYCPSIYKFERRYFAINVYYVNYKMFDIRMRWAIRRLVFSEYHDVATNNVTEQSKEGNWVKKYFEGQDKDYNVIHWSQSGQDTDFQVKIGNKTNFPMFIKSKVCDCLKKFGNVIFIGDSHMRYKYFYILEHCHGIAIHTIAQISSMKKFENLHFFNMFLVEDYNTTTKIYKEINSGKMMISDKPNMMIMQIGAHDLAHGLFLDGFYKRVSEYMDIVHEIQKLYDLKNNEITIIPPPPTTMDLPNYKQRTLPAMEAFNSRLRKETTVNKYRYFDEISLFKPVVDYEYCKGHFICPIYDGELFHSYGLVGIPALKILFTGICQEQFKTQCN